MSYRELLELAAKAAGYEVDAPYYDESDQLLGLVLVDGTLFNSRENDGDALRLAVKLGIDLCFGANYVIARGSVQMPSINNANDPCAATRLAITRAAAEIGRMMC